MKKIYTLLAGFILFSSFTSKGQDTLLYEGFQEDSITYIGSVTSPPPGNTTDTMWYNYDADQLADGSPGATRSDFWYLSRAFADTNVLAPGTADTNIVLISNSWFQSPGGLASNWLITRNILLGANDTLFWKSAPFQTPRYCDGYQVLISTTNNMDTEFKDTLFTAAEMLTLSGTSADSTYGGYTFSSGFIHGLDGTFTEFAGDSAHLRGVLKPFSQPLTAYANQNVFIAFHHNSFDDNLISIDDIMIRGTLNPNLGIKENKFNLNLNIFPNPAKDHAQLNYELATETEVTIIVNDITGKLIYSENRGSLGQGRHFATINTAALAKGFYTISVLTNDDKSTAKLIVQ